MHSIDTHVTTVCPGEVPAATVTFSRTRRRFTRALGTALLMPMAATWIAPLTARADDAGVRARRRLMGTWIDVVVADGAQPGVEAAVAAAFAEMARLEGLMSRYAPDSVVTTLNRAAGREAIAVPPEMLAVLLDAQSLTTRTGGRFDVAMGRLTPGPGGVEAGRVPDDDAVRAALRHVRTGGLTIDARRSTARIGNPLVQIDLGGVAKLPILSVGLATLSAHGIRGAMVNGGGDVLASARFDGRPWRIGVRDPAVPDTLLAVLPLHAGVVASSGDYERFVMHAGRPYHHVIDPATGRPSRGVHGVTLVADSVARVNGLGTAAMVAGPRDGPALLARCGVREAMMVGADGRTWISPALARRLVPPPGRDRIRGQGASA